MTDNSAEILFRDSLTYSGLLLWPCLEYADAYHGMLGDASDRHEWGCLVDGWSSLWLLMYTDLVLKSLVCDNEVCVFEWIPNFSECSIQDFESLSDFLRYTKIRNVHHHEFFNATRWKHWRITAWRTWRVEAVMLRLCASLMMTPSGPGVMATMGSWVCGSFLLVFHLIGLLD